MEEQFVGVGYVFDIEQFDFRVGVRVEVFVHVLKHVFYTDLFTVANRPYRVKL